VFADLGRVLAAGGARPDQVTKITIFVAAMGRDQLPAIEAGRVPLFGDHKPADTLVGVCVSIIDTAGHASASCYRRVDLEAGAARMPPLNIPSTSPRAGDR
jgi:enamine deaminase RidA (YjgF/YER057c/UK114 family)